MPKVDPLPGPLSRVPPLPAPTGDTAGRAAAPEFLGVARDPTAPAAEPDRGNEDGAAGPGRDGATPLRPSGPVRRFNALRAAPAYARSQAAEAGPEAAGEEPAQGPGQRLEGRLAILRGNAAGGHDLTVRPFIDQPTAQVLLRTLNTLPRSSRQDLEGAISQLEGFRQSYALPRATEANTSDLLTRLRGELRSLPSPTDVATAQRRPTLEAATARAILDSLTSPPPTGRQQIDAAAAQLVGLTSRYALPAGLLRQAGGLLRGWEAASGRLPPIAQERAIIAYLDTLAFAPKGSGLPPLANPADERDEIATYADRPFLHPAVRNAADRALAFVPRESASVWERPSLWSLSSPRLQRSIYRQTRIMLAQCATGQPNAVDLLSTMFGNAPARLRTFAGELALRAPAGSELRQLALHVRDTATRVAEPGSPERLHVPERLDVPARPHASAWPHVPTRSGRPAPMARPDAAAMIATFERLHEAIIHMSKVPL